MVSIIHCIYLNYIYLNFEKNFISNYTDMHLPESNKQVNNEKKTNK